MKILVAVPCMDQVPARFAHCLSTLKRVGETSVAFQIGSLVYTSRNTLGMRALQDGADYVMWFDSDMIFEPDIIEKMLKHLENSGVDMVTGVYFRRVPPFTPVLFDELEVREDGYGCHWTEFQGELPDHLFEVGGCGFGCVLMRADVLINVIAKFDCMFDPIKGMGEDISFCWRARQCGFKIYCDPTIQCGHVGTTIINKSFYDMYNKARGEAPQS